jgi:ABC-2 type transport system permease protein
MGCLSLITANVMFVNNTVYFLLLIFSGANVALDTLPNWMQAFSQILPLTRGITSARILIAGGSFAEVTPLLTSEIGIGLIYGWLGYMLFKWFEFQAKRKGSLETV